VLPLPLQRCRPGRVDLCNAHTWSAAWDAVVGGCFALAYYSYFMLVRQSLDIFACTAGPGGQYRLNSDPSIACWTPGCAQQQLVPYAALSLIVYGMGIPVLFATVLARHRDAVRVDQTLWLLGRGSSRLDNPHYSVRHRYARLYQDYRPRYLYWRLILLARKLCLVSVTVLASNNSMFQASLFLATLATAYSLHMKHQPFVSAAAQTEALQNAAGALSNKQAYSGDETSAAGAAACDTREPLVDFNAMETMLLCSCVAIILQGMVFQSAEFTPGGAAYIILTIMTAVVMIGAVLLFLLNLFREARRTCQPPASALAEAAAAGTRSKQPAVTVVAEAQIIEPPTGRPLHAARNLLTSLSLYVGMSRNPIPAREHIADRPGGDAQGSMESDVVTVLQSNPLNVMARAGTDSKAGDIESQATTVQRGMSKAHQMLTPLSFYSHSSLPVRERSATTRPKPGTPGPGATESDVDGVERSDVDAWEELKSFETRPAEIASSFEMQLLHAEDIPRVLPVIQE
jgi:hypothetical protein